jgi:hypothetical protein
VDILNVQKIIEKIKKLSNLQSLQRMQVSIIKPLISSLNTNARWEEERKDNSFLNDFRNRE